MEPCVRCGRDLRCSTSPSGQCEVGHGHGSVQRTREERVPVSSVIAFGYVGFCTFLLHREATQRLSLLTRSLRARAIRWEGRALLLENATTTR